MKQWNYRPALAGFYAASLTALLAGCAMDVPSDDPAISSSAEELWGSGVSVDNTYRPEVGNILGNCTATLVDENWILFAGHCFNFLEQIDQGSGGARLGTFQVTDSGGNTTTYAIDTHFTLGTGLGGEDVALGRLASSVPGSIATPATIATSIPSSGSRTDVGYGNFGATLATCNQNDGQKRVITHGVNAAVRSCPGDSGGPAFVGTKSALGAIMGIHSTTASDANPVQFRSEIDNIMLWWDSYASYDISNTGWCSGNAIMYGDYDGDGHVDAFCQDGNTIRVARGQNRLTYSMWTSNGVWCSGSGQELHVGDFNGDGNTDLLCWDSDDGRKWIDYSSGSSSSPFANTSDFYYGGNWCSHSGAKLHMGDFNGDSRTDILCHDTQGRIWVDYANSSGQFGNTDSYDAGPWCSHSGARFFTGDFNGDAITDALCHTSTSGAIDVAESQGGSNPFVGTTWFDYSIDFCNGGGATVEVWNGNQDFLGGDETADLHCNDPGAGAQRSVPYTLWGQVDPETARFKDDGALGDGEGATFFQNSTRRPSMLRVSDGFANHY